MNKKHDRAALLSSVKGEDRLLKQFWLSFYTDSWNQERIFILSLLKYNQRSFCW